jgi:signal peptidase II
MILNFIIISIIIIIDQVSKFLIEKNFIDINTIPVIQDFFHLTYVKNRGVAFGFFYGHVYVFVFIALAAIIGMVLYLHKYM